MGLVDKKDAIEVTFAGDNAPKSQRYSRVLVAVGRRPNSAGLGLENTKVQIDTKGFIVTDQQKRTADPHILAIGDVAGEPMLATRRPTKARWPWNFSPANRRPSRPGRFPR